MKVYKVYPDILKTNLYKLSRTHRRAVVAVAVAAVVVAVVAALAVVTAAARELPRPLITHKFYFR